MFRFISLFLTSLFAGLSCLIAVAQVKKDVTYHNPVIAGDFADPSVIRVGDTYYAAGTSSEWGPAYPIYTSKDLVNWQYLGPVFSEMPSWTMGSFWAPELYYRNGTFYVYYTARRKSDQHSYIGVATTTDIRKGFTDHGCIIEWTNEAIDAFIIEDAGKLYITWKAYGLDQGKLIQLLGRELTPDGLKVQGEVLMLLQADPNSWEAGGMEGQALFKHGDYFYMTYSGNICCGPDCNYMVGLARAKSLKGPWERYADNPVLKSSNDWKCPGHGTVVTTPDNRYFYLHHAYSGTDFTFIGRQGVLSELIWDKKTGWPAFRYGTTTPVEGTAATGKTQQQQLSVSADFSKDKASSINWVWDVSQPKPAYAVRNGYLELTSPSNGTQASSGSFLGLVLKKGNYTFTTEILPQATSTQSICLYGDAENTLNFGITKDSLQLWQVKEGKKEILQSRVLPKGKGSIRLQVQSTKGHLYQFRWGRAEAKMETFNAQAFEANSLPRWDRAPRIGLQVSGTEKQSGLFRFVSVVYP
ncbi:glycoside hydrolase family 43 protein [Xanthocytophaga agilis]|uniref:Glycoside hydrolase family 43 protein n=1 Tax=Xanthocytophaga agilis TaxID=3048010 RepID=A0AAE3UG41_9BACT|nr:glycoside hydrolase family 43 protein [Xanthocytophaga agilis]MDJ1502037.1 glycoside hydrolase family 43 protein [Xanthocytophaga agilis]